jgi:hypothetical protein
MTPRDHIHWFPPEGFSDPTGEVTAQIVSSIAAAWKKARETGEDFVTAGGDVRVTLIPQAGEELEDGSESAEVARGD